MWKPLIALAALVVPLAAMAQAAWPTQPVKVVIAGAAGSGTDIAARVILDALSKKFGQPFVPDNRAGANGMIATEVVAKAPKDGYTLLFTYAAAQVVNQSLYAKVPYDGAKDFAAVAQVGAGGNVLVVPPSMPVKDLREFVAYAKAQPAGALAYGSWGIGSGGHLSMEALNQKAGLTLRHIPYKGTGPMLTDLIGGQIQVGFSATATAIPMIQAGKLKALAYSAPTRTAILPELKTMSEQGVPFDLVAWYGVFAPAGTPAPIVLAINQEINRFLQAPDSAEKLKAVGLSDWPIKTPEQFAETVRNDIRGWGEVVRKGNIQAE
ncbi:MAG: tripartite tricarboxylate transporter substrate binding protein [Rhodoferax sp.]